MYRARREIEPNIPRSAAEFCQQIQSTQFVVYYRGEVTVSSEIGVLFYSDKLSQVFVEVKDIQFNGTFYTVPIQFYQLWTLFARIGRHVVPCILCILTSKLEALYTALLQKFVSFYLNCYQLMECLIGKLDLEMHLRKYFKEFIFITHKISGENWEN